MKTGRHYKKYHLLRSIPTCNIIEIENITNCLKLNQSPSLDGLTIEHITHAHPCVLSIITKLFNHILKYEYVPNDFGVSLTFPIPKDKSSSARNSLSNYRGISISPIISKIFEKLLLSRFSKYLTSSDFNLVLKNILIPIMLSITYWYQSCSL